MKSNISSPHFATPNKDIMELPINQFKRNLAAGKPQIGLWMSFYAHQVVESCAPAGFDWMLLDTEHAPNDPHMVHTQLLAARGLDGQCTSHPVVRPASLQVEYRRIDSYTYLRGRYNEVYQQLGRPLGSELGPDADLFRRKLFVAHRALTTVRVERADRGASTRRIRRLMTPMVTDATTPAATGMIIGEASAAIDVAEPSPPVAPIAIRPAVSPVVAVAVAIVVAAEIPASAPRLFTKQAALISPERSFFASRTPPMVALIAAPATVAREVTRPRLAAAVPRLLIAVRPAVARVSTVARVWLDAATVIRPFATRTAFVI